MARARNIKPGFFTNDLLGELPPLARLLFAGLWTICDREGRVEDRPKKIRAEVLPYDDCDADELLQMLSASGFIARYFADGVSVIQVLAWDKHQNPHVKEAASTLPAPDKHGASTVQASDKAQPKPERAGLIPSSLIPDPLSPKAPAPLALSGRFEEFWTAYPSKVGKDAARKAFEKRKPDAELLARMLKAIEAQRGSEKWRKDGGQYIPNPATWLNQARWEDETTTVAGPSLTVPANPESGRELARMEAERIARANRTPEQIAQADAARKAAMAKLGVAA